LDDSELLGRVDDDCLAAQAAKHDRKQTNAERARAC
jgi:hypothetical protein